MGSRRLGTAARVGAALAFAILASATACSSTPTSNTSPGTAAPFGSTPPPSGPAKLTDGQGSPSGWLSDPTTWRTVKAADGRTFVADAQGRALQLRGFNIKTEDPAKDASDDLLEAGHQRGFNFLRLSIYWDQFEPTTKGTYDEAYLDAIGAAVDRAAAHGIYVVLDFHQDVYGKKYGGAGIPAWATNDEGLPFAKQDVWLLNYLQPAVQAAWEHLYEDADIRDAQAASWAFVAKRFKDKPSLIGYDLLNEPFGKLRPGETVADAAERMQRTQLTEMYQRLTDAMRAVDPGHWIFFEPPNVASLGVPVALSKVNGDKLIYYPHFYDAAIESATYTPGQEVDGFDPAFFKGWAKAVSEYPATHGYPMMVGEWGIAHPEKPGMDAFVAQSLALMDELASGWTVFNWCQGDGYCPLDKDGKDRPAIGQIVQPWVRSIAGTPVSFGYDPKTRVLKIVLTTSDATGATDIVVPATAFPEGFDVASNIADGGWTSSTDLGTYGGATTVSFIAPTAPPGSTQVICVHPKGVSTPCDK
jgi:endoglycosylceramidase